LFINNNNNIKLLVIRFLPAYLKLMLGTLTTVVLAKMFKQLLKHKGQKGRR